jgi:hypothetical protein
VRGWDVAALNTTVLQSLWAALFASFYHYADGERRTLRGADRRTPLLCCCATWLHRRCRRSRRSDVPRTMEDWCVCEGVRGGRREVGVK